MSITTSAPRKMGWLPDRPDHRDRLFGTPHTVNLANLPASVDLTPHCPPVWDQGNLGACSSHAVAGAFVFDAMRQGLQVVMPSRLDIYYQERKLEGTTATDSGARLRDGIKALATGVCPESEWPYNVSRFADAPPNGADAHEDRGLRYARVAQSLMQMKAVLAAGYPIVLGFTVFESFMTEQVAETGIAPMPQPGEQIEGGHAVLLVGYTSETWILRNSWGASWGHAGYFTLPTAFLLDPGLASDLWVVQSVSEQ